MLDVVIALMPAFIWSIYIFGVRALSVTAITVASSVLFEYLYRKLMKKDNTIGDLSAVVTGILLAFNLPVSVPLWLPVIGSFFAIVVVKQLYGGIGKNVVNPALAARVFLFIAYSSEMTSFSKVGEHLPAFQVELSKKVVDIVSTATPLQSLQKGNIPHENLMDLFVGRVSGSFGEISALLLILGGVYLIIRKVITLHIPLAYIGTVAILTFFFPNNMNGLNFCAYELFAGGLMIGAFFMATDYTTSPITAKGRIIYGVGCGLITVFIRYFGYPEGVSFSILIMNLFVWYLDKWTKPQNFGGGKLAKAKE
jgi:electron transport complex, RnfABCDGE type, D subunit